MKVPLVARIYWVMSNDNNPLRLNGSEGLIEPSELIVEILKGQLALHFIALGVFVVVLNEWGCVNSNYKTQVLATKGVLAWQMAYQK